MTKIADELSKNAEILRARALEAEKQWRAARGLDEGLHRKGNAKGRKRRRRAVCPKEPKANVRFRRYRDKRLGKMGAASTVRRIDPETGDRNG
jgi:hypothetical protein